MVKKVLMFLGLIYISATILFYGSFLLATAHISNPFQNIIKVSKTEYLNSDFIAFLTGGEIVKQNKTQHLYSLPLQQETQNKILSTQREGVRSFRNLPMVAAAFSILPTTTESLLKTFRILLLLEMFLLILVIAYLFKNFNKDWVFVTLMTLSFYPTFFSIYQLQFSLITLLALIFIYKALKSGNDLKAGVACCLLLIKPQYLILFPFFLMLSKSKKQFSIYALTSLVFVVILNIFFYGPSLLWEYPRFLFNSENIDAGTKTHLIFSFLGLFTWIKPQNLTIPLTIITSVIFYISSLVYLIKSQKHSFESKFSIALLITSLTAIHVSNADLVFFLIPILVLINYYKQTQKLAYILMASVLYLSVIMVSEFNIWVSVLAITLVTISWLFTPDSHNQTPQHHQP